MMIIGTMRVEESIVHDTWEGYHSFHSETDDLLTGERDTYGSFEIFWADANDVAVWNDSGLDYTYREGWYWWACFPGCLPDGDPSGPFATSRQALEDADEWSPEFDDEYA